MRHNGPMPEILTDIISDISAFGSLSFFWLIALIFLLTGHYTSFWFLALAHIIAYAVTAPLRVLFFRERPHKKAYHNWFEKIDAGSFPSMHAARSVILATGFFSLFSSAFVQGTIIALGLFVCVTRAILKKHYVSDILAGIAIGGGASMILILL